MRLAKSQEFSISLSTSWVDLFHILLASCFIAVLAQIKIPLFFTPVPLAFTTLGIMLVGAVLGSYKGTLAILCYLIQGCFGLPVWAGGLSTGCYQFLCPTGGYLVGYLIQVYFVGWFLEKQERFSVAKTMSILLVSISLQMGVGSLWLSQFVGIKNCLMFGFLPFVFGEVLKALFVVGYLKSYQTDKL